MQTLILIVGKTRSGKDTVAKYITEKYGISPVVSYTTRDIRFGELDGREHYFVSESQMKEILDSEDMIAYVKKASGIEYGASLQCISEDVMSYIIDPDGVKYLKEHYADKVNLHILYVNCPDDLILERAAKTNVDLEVTASRLEDEHIEFDSFMQDSANYSYLINNDKTLDYLCSEVDKFMQKINIKDKISE